MLINELLDLAKIQSGIVELHLQRVVCQEVIDEVVANVRPLAEGKGLRFEVVAPAEPVVLETDRRALSQILFNLTNNPIKFTDRGEVRIALARPAARPMVAEAADLASIESVPSSFAVGEGPQAPSPRPSVSSGSVVAGQPWIVIEVSDTGSGIGQEAPVCLFGAFAQGRTADVRAREGTGLGLQLSQWLAELLGGSIEFTSELGQGSTFRLRIMER
ncbi:MAG TPA: ATP-binding protein [Roseiflexaceae bacterium]|nr:ATP-binding protein [Roseiflexaceae bacterium]